MGVGIPWMVAWPRDSMDFVLPHGQVAQDVPEMAPVYRNCIRYRKHVDEPQNRYFLFMREFTDVFITPSLYKICR